jgi:putative nucleotidyltransferase with HDIG domain
MAALHMRTIEALAMAIEAKDQNTHDHLERVRVYAVEVAKKLNLPADELEALRAAALLHDIGKLAVPEHIISKPGRLTPEEFEKMKIHPVVGAEILERVRFPYPVVPIVRAHHEKWDGSGYPQGLVGEAIPIGARILAAVDCFDALASDRQYRKALPLNEAMAKVVADAGKAFDPRVVEILHRRYIELEKLAHAQPQESPAKLSTDIKVERGSAPAAGFAASEDADEGPANATADTRALIAAAQRAGREIVEFSRQPGTPLHVEDIFSLLSVRLQHLAPHESMVVYCPKDDLLIPAFVSGENFRLFHSLRIPLGEGLSGWVAQNHKAILNGNPSVEPGYLNDPTKYSTLRSALAMPIEGSCGMAAVLALYRSAQDAFTAEDLRLVEAVAAGLGGAIEAAGKLKAASVAAR